MRIRSPQPGTTDPSKTLAQPGGGAAHSNPANGTSATNSASPQPLKTHPTLISLARLLGRQVAREASDTGGTNG